MLNDFFSPSQIIWKAKINSLGAVAAEEAVTKVGGRKKPGSQTMD